jgi:hypothetical protein
MAEDQVFLLDGLDQKVKDLFIYDNWQKASFEERLVACIEVEKYMANLQGRKPCSVQAKYFSDNTYGEYQNSPEIIFINTRLLKQKRAKAKVLNSILHEIQHAYDAHLLMNPDLAANKLDLVAIEECFALKCYNEKDPLLYRFGLAEIRAREFAHEQTALFFERTLGQQGLEDKGFRECERISKAEQDLAQESAIKKYGKHYLKKIKLELHDLYQKEYQFRFSGAVLTLTKKIADCEGKLASLRVQAENAAKIKVLGEKASEVELTGNDVIQKKIKTLTEQLLRSGEFSVQRKQIEAEIKTAQDYISNRSLNNTLNQIPNLVRDYNTMLKYEEVQLKLSHEINKMIDTAKEQIINEQKKRLDKVYAEYEEVITNHFKNEHTYSDSQRAEALSKIDGLLLKINNEKALLENMEADTKKEVYQQSLKQIAANNETRKKYNSLKVHLSNANIKIKQITARYDIERSNPALSKQNRNYVVNQNNQQWQRVISR